jgi:carboxysome shell carbonic anhydrase
MMSASRKISGPNKAWRSGWVSPASGPTQASSAKRMAPTAVRRATPTLVSTGQRHPFAEPAIAQELERRETEIETTFSRLAETLRDLAPKQFEHGFPDTAVSRLRTLGIDAEPAWFDADWTRPLVMADLHARLICRVFAKLVETGGDRSADAFDEGEPVGELIRRWGFHAVDITPCADGRLAGLLGAVLRIPLSIVTARKSFAGAMFNVAQNLHEWEEVELTRHRKGTPTRPESGTRYLKIGVYHFSSADPRHAGCAAHHSDDASAVGALHNRLLEFQTAAEAMHGAGQEIALLLIGVDTDTDAIRVHVPDASGAMDDRRYIDAAQLHGLTRDMPREAAKDAVRNEVARVAGVRPDDKATEGVRWFCGYLLKNNIAQIDAVLQKFGGPYAVSGHAEKLMVIGDAVDDVQLRNLAFQAQMNSVEEGANDVRVGLSILGQSTPPSVPVLILRSFDPDIPGDDKAAAEVAGRMRAAVMALDADAPILVEAALRPNSGGALKFLEVGT